MKDYGLIYLATPYSKYPHGLQDAFVSAAKLAGQLLKKGAKCYSPIAHTHPIAIHGSIDPYAHDIWLPFDEAIMNVSDCLFVAMMNGWLASKGVEHEILFFRDAKKPVYLLDPASLEATRWS